jgi:hypothetical protein
MSDQLVITSGDTPTFTITVTGTDLTVAGTTLRFKASGAGGATIEKTNAPAAGITVLSGTQASMAFTAADTAGLDGRRLSWDLEHTVAGVVTTLARGDLFVTRDA